MNLAHPFRVALCKIVVDGDDMHALTRKRVEVCGKGGNKRLAFARLHFGNSALMQAYAADNLNVEVLHFKHAPACFP